MSENQLPTIASLYEKDSLPVLQRDAVLQVLVNQEPKKEWVQVHPVTKDEYIPIERIEWLLTNIFIKWRVEIKSTQLIGNSVVVSVRLHYFNYIENEWSWQDGVGASPLQTDKGAGAIEFDKLKSGAVQMAVPAAESYAVKDAAEKIGKLFGKDLNRKNNLQYQGLSAQGINFESLTELYEQKKATLTPKEVEYAERILNTKEEKSYKKLYNTLLQQP